jgi:ParB-like chromosome segregation protein Spo0J
MADRVEIWSIDRLIPSTRNARTHSEGQIAEIAGSIAAFGFIVPVLVDREGMIIARRGRVLAARKLKLEPSRHLDSGRAAISRAPGRAGSTRGSDLHHLKAQ